MEPARKSYKDRMLIAIRCWLDQRLSSQKKDAKSASF